jgi:hypothetical protein
MLRHGITLDMFMISCRTNETNQEEEKYETPPEKKESNEKNFLAKEIFIINDETE